MGLGKIARGAGKVGLVLEAAGYVIAAGRALVNVIKGDPAARRDKGVRQDRDGDSDAAGDPQ